MTEVVRADSVLSAIYYSKEESCSGGSPRLIVTKYRTSRNDYFKLILFRNSEIALTTRGVQGLFFAAGVLETTTTCGDRCVYHRAGSFKKGVMICCYDLESFRLSTRIHTPVPFSYVIGTVVAVMEKGISPEFTKQDVRLFLR